MARPRKEAFKALLVGRGHGGDGRHDAERMSVGANAKHMSMVPTGSCQYGKRARNKSSSSKTATLLGDYSPLRTEEESCNLAGYCSQF